MYLEELAEQDAVKAECVRLLQDGDDPPPKEGPECRANEHDLVPFQNQELAGMKAVGDTKKDLCLFECDTVVAENVKHEYLLAEMNGDVKDLETQRAQDEGMILSRTLTGDRENATTPERDEVCRAFGVQQVEETASPQKATAQSRRVQRRSTLIRNNALTRTSHDSDSGPDVGDRMRNQLRDRQERRKSRTDTLTEAAQVTPH